MLWKAEVLSGDTRGLSSWTELSAIGDRDCSRREFAFRHRLDNAAFFLSR